MNDKIRKVILEGSIGRALLALSMPIILGNLLQTGYQLADAFWVGRLGAPAVAAVAVSFPVTFLVIALGSGLAMAGAVLIAQYVGAGRQDMVDHVAGQTMMMVLLTSILLGAAGYLLAPGLLTLLGVAQDERAGALGFMRVSFVGVVFVFTYAMFQALMRGIGCTRLPLLIVLLNFALDPLFIFGWGPKPAPAPDPRSCRSSRFPPRDCRWRCLLSSVRTSERTRPSERRRSLASASSTGSGRSRHLGSSHSQTPPKLVAFFVPSDSEVIAAAAGFLRIMALTWGDIESSSASSGCSASGHMVHAMAIALVSQWVIQFPLAYVLSTHSYLHADGIWWSFPASNLATAVLALAWFASGNWKRGRLTGEIRQTVRIIDETIEEGV